MAYNKKNTSYLITLAALFYVLTGCEGGGTPIQPDEGGVFVNFSVDCQLLVCSIDASVTVSSSDPLDSLLCNMGDGSQIDLLLLETVFDYTYGAPGSYNITCSAESANGDSDSDLVVINVDGLLVDAGLNQSVSANTTVTLDGSGSTDTTFNTTGNVINRYQWINTNSVPARQQLTIINPESVNATFLAPDDAQTVTYTISLRVSVDDGATFSENSDLVDIDVVPAGLSDLPQ